MKLYLFKRIKNFRPEKSIFSKKLNIFLEKFLNLKKNYFKNFNFSGRTL